MCSRKVFLWKVIRSCLWCLSSSFSSGCSTWEEQAMCSATLFRGKHMSICRFQDRPYEVQLYKHFHCWMDENATATFICGSNQRRAGIQSGVCNSQNAQNYEWLPSSISNTPHRRLLALLVLLIALFVYLFQTRSHYLESHLPLPLKCCDLRHVPPTTPDPIAWSLKEKRILFQ